MVFVAPFVLFISSSIYKPKLYSIKHLPPMYLAGIYRNSNCSNWLHVMPAFKYYVTFFSFLQNTTKIRGRPEDYAWLYAGYTLKNEKVILIIFGSPTKNVYFFSSSKIENSYELNIFMYTF